MGQAYGLCQCLIKSRLQYVNNSPSAVYTSYSYLVRYQIYVRKKGICSMVIAGAFVENAIC
jgi:hypothetical protein